MTSLSWTPREGHPLVWDAEINARDKATIVAGIQKFEGKKVLEIETFGCFIGETSLGQRGTLASAKELCELIASNIAPEPPPHAELHLWRMTNYGPHRRVEGCVYGDPKFDDGSKITTDNIVSLDWDAEGDIITTVEHRRYRLCREERSASLIAAGYMAAELEKQLREFAPPVGGEKGSDG